jgi:hypothetical protein
VAIARKRSATFAGTGETEARWETKEMMTTTTQREVARREEKRWNRESRVVLSRRTLVSAPQPLGSL